MRAQELPIQLAGFLPQVNQRQRQRQIGAGKNRQVQVHFPGGKVPERIDYRNEGAVLFGLAQERHQMNVGSFGIGAPEQNELGVAVVLKGHARHLAVHAGGHLGGGSRAQGLGQAGGAQLGEEEVVQKAVAQQAVGAAVVVRQNSFAAPPLEYLLEAADNLDDGLLPGNAGERARPLGPAAAQGEENAVGVIDALGEARHFVADESVGRGVFAAPADALNPAVLDRDFQRAGVRAIHGAGGGDDSGSHRTDFLFGCRHHSEACAA